MFKIFMYPFIGKVSDHVFKVYLQRALPLACKLFVLKGHLVTMDFDYTL